MNLAQIRDYLAELSENNPDNQNYKNFVDDTINLALNEIWLMKPWIFSFKEKELQLRPDITGSETGISLTVLNMSRQVVFDDIVRDLGDSFYQDDWQGQVIEIEGRDYHILKSAVVGSATIMFLNEPYRSVSSLTLSSYSGWTIKHRYYNLPEDLVTLVSFTHKDYPIVNTSTQSAYLDTIISQDLCSYSDITSNYASIIYKAPDLNIPPGEKISKSTSNSASTDAFPEGIYLEFAWAFMFANEYGPLSESTGVFQVPDTAGNYSTITVNCLDNFGRAIATPTRANALDKPKPIRYEGLKKVLFYNTNIDQDTGERLGNPCWKMVSNFDTAETQLEYLPLIINDATSSFSLSYYYQLFNSEMNNIIVSIPGESIERRYLPHKTQRIRPYPRVSAIDKDYSYQVITTDYYAVSDPFKAAIIRYIYKPNQLILDQDESPLPPEFSNLLIYKSLENILLKNMQSERAAFYALKFEKELKALERKFINTPQHSIGRESRNSLLTYPLFRGQRVTSGT